MFVLGLDLETTGLDVTNDRIIEIGCVLWDVNKRRPLQFISEFLWEPEYPDPLPKQIMEITGLDAEVLRIWGKPPVEVLSKVLQLSYISDFLVAHNGTTFDRPLLENEMKRVGLMPKDDMSWIDTSVDIPYDPAIQTRKLTYLASEHGFINPFQHRAVFDVLTMLKIFSQYNYTEILKLQASPNITVQAMVEYSTKELAREAGYRWNPEKKAWLKIVKKCYLDKEYKRDFKILELYNA